MMQNKNLLIAITGGIGSGKSQVSTLLKRWGYTVYSADEVYAELLSCSEFVKQIHQAVGVEDNSPALNRKAVSNAVFASPEKLAVLNNLTHSKIMERLMDLSKNKGVVFNEVPLLFEGGFESFYDKVIVVTRPLDMRVQSVIERDGLTREEVLKRIKNQFDYAKITNTKHTVIVNDLTLQSLEDKVKVALNEIL